MNKATIAGFHFYNLYQCCGRKFYIHNYLKVRPRFESVPLLNGALFHYGKERFYTSGSRDTALHSLEAAIKEHRNKFEEAKDYVTVATRLPMMLKKWIDEHGKNDLRNFRLLEVEQEHRIYFDGGFFTTVRPDAVVENRDGELIIMETKTTAYSAAMTEVFVQFGDQATAYLAAISRKYPKRRVAGVLPDIVAWLKNSRKKEDIVCSRKSLVCRDKEEIEEWSLSTSFLLSEISQKIGALKKYPPIALFPRNTTFCISYNRCCEYLKICRRDLEGDAPIPGYVRESEVPDEDSLRAVLSGRSSSKPVSSPKRRRS